MNVARPQQPGSGWDHRSLLDLTHCPVCGAVLPGPVCSGCGVDLSGPHGARLWELSARAADALAERDAFLRTLHDAAARRGTAPQFPQPSIPQPSIPQPDPSPISQFPQSSQPSIPQPGPFLVSRIGVQGLLVALGALLLAVAGVVFLVFTWDRLSLGWRALVIALITGAALAGAVWLRPRLPETAEAVGGLAVVLVLADAWAVRATGLLGADRLDGAGYAALVAAACAFVLGAWGWIGRIRVGSLGAALIGPCAPVLAGAWLAPDDLDRGARAVALGLVGAALVTTLRRWTPQPWRAERALLRGMAGLATVLALAIAILFSDRPASLAAVLALVAVSAALQAAVDGVTAARSEPWSLLAGATAALAVGAGAVAGVRSLGLDPAWRFAAGPVASSATAWGVLAVAGRRPGVRRVDHRLAARAARAAALAACLPAAAVVAAQVGLVVLAAVLHPWSASFGGSAAGFAHLPASVAPGGSVPQIRPVLHLASVLGLAGAAALLAASRPHRWALAVAGLAVLAAVGGPASPALAVGAVVGLLLVVAVGSAAAAARLEVLPGAPGWDRSLVGRAALATAAGAGLLAVLTSWGVREISVPVTLIGVAGLLLARRVVPPGAAVALVAAAVVAGAVAGGAAAGLVASSPLIDRVAVAGVVAAVLAGLLAAVPLPGFPPGDPARAQRRAGVAAGFAVGLLGAPALEASGVPARLAAVLGALTLAAGAGAVRAPRDGSPAGPRLPTVLAAALTPLAATAAVAAAAATTAAATTAAATLAAAAVITIAGSALAAVGLRAPGDPRRIPAEMGAAVTASVVLLAGSAVAAGQDWWWILLLLLGAAVAAIAIPADRHRAGWVGWILLTASGWVRLRDADVGLVEAYTVPSASALLAVAVLRLRRDRSFTAHRTLLPGLGLALVPSVVAAAHGSPWRPAVLLGLAAAAVAGSARWVTRPVPGVDIALGAGAVVAAGTGLLRPIVTVLDDVELRWIAGGSPLGVPWYRVELWSFTAALILALAALLAWRRPLAWAGPDRHRARLRPFLGLPALLVAAGPSLVAVWLYSTVGGSEAGWSGRAAAARAGAVLVGAGAVAVLRAWRPGTPVLTRPVGLTAVAASLVAAGAGLLAGLGEVEAWTTPAAVVLLGVGVLAMRLTPELGSWPALGPGLGLLLLPTLLLALSPDGVWRIVVLAAGAAVVVVAGVFRGWQAPVVIGAAVLALHAVAQLGPWVARTVAGQPRWVTLGLVGAALLAVGAGYERQRRGLRALRVRLGALR